MTVSDRCPVEDHCSSDDVKKTSSSILKINNFESMNIWSNHSVVFSIWQPPEITSVEFKKNNSSTFQITRTYAHSREKFSRDQHWPDENGYQVIWWDHMLVSIIMQRNMISREIIQFWSLKWSLKITFP